MHFIYVQLYFMLDNYPFMFLFAAQEDKIAQEGIIILMFRYYEKNVQIIQKNYFHIETLFGSKYWHKFSNGAVYFLNNVLKQCKTIKRPLNI